MLIIAAVACSIIIYGGRVMRATFSTRVLAAIVATAAIGLLDWRHNGRGETPFAVYLLIAVLANVAAAVVASVVIREQWKNSIALIISIIAWIVIARGCIWFAYLYA